MQNKLRRDFHIIPVKVAKINKTNRSTCRQKGTHIHCLWKKGTHIHCLWKYKLITAAVEISVAGFWEAGNIVLPQDPAKPFLVIHTKLAQKVTINIKGLFKSHMEAYYC